MNENNWFIKDGTIYDTTDVCRKKNRCATAMCLLSVLELIYIVIIDICIHVPGRGRSKIEVINGYKKKYLEKNMHDRY